MGSMIPDQRLEIKRSFRVAELMKDEVSRNQTPPSCLLRD